MADDETPAARQRRFDAWKRAGYIPNEAFSLTALRIKPGSNFGRRLVRRRQRFIRKLTTQERTAEEIEEILENNYMARQDEVALINELYEGQEELVLARS